MSEQTSTQQVRPNVFLKVAVIGSGLILFLLLFFADKTNLTNQERPAITETGVAQTATNSTATLPPLAPRSKA